VLEPGVPVGEGSPCTSIVMKVPSPQPAQLSAGFVPPIENGVPEYAEPIPLICQFCAIRPRRLLEPFANGSS
jgi:hypothetical protein